MEFAAPTRDVPEQEESKKPRATAASAEGRGREWWSLLREYWLPLAVLAWLAIGAIVGISPAWSSARRDVWLVGLLVTGAPIVWQTIRGLLAGRFAADVVASLAILTAIVLLEPVAGLVIALMQSGGESLERYAAGRASEAVRELEAAAPRLAHRRDSDGAIHDINASDALVGDTLLVRPGELVPCDGVVLDGRSHVDTSRLTGEPFPVAASTGTTLMSGSINAEGPLTIRATAVSRESQYQRIVELVRAAQASKAPLQRVADRYAVWFTPVTVLACALAYVFSGDPTRVLAVLVVATPCPLLLATPVAIIGGINRAARRRIVVRSGAALEQLGAVTIAVFDKTGTLTIGRPRVSRVRSTGRLSSNEVLRLAGGVDQGSSHLLARTLVDAAREGGLHLPEATGVVESPGRGVSGVVEGHKVTVGARSLVAADAPAAAADLELLERDGAVLRAYVAVDGAFAGTIEYADELRPGLDRFLADLRSLGLRRAVLLSGDRDTNARAVAAAVAITEVWGDLLPADKVDVVRRLSAQGERVLMVGDGTNDAPALSAAAVGVALASHGGGITAEAAGVVVLADDVTRVADAVRIGQRTMRIARQSIWAGLGMSAAAMVVASFGMIPPAAGALLQEGIDIAVILNALRASRG